MCVLPPTIRVCQPLYLCTQGQNKAKRVCIQFGKKTLVLCNLVHIDSTLIVQFITNNFFLIDNVLNYLRTTNEGDWTKWVQGTDVLSKQKIDLSQNVQ
jgi:hypothetical protein